MCCLTSITSLTVDGQTEVGVEHDRLELLRFLASDFAPMNELCDRGHMFERLIYERSKALFLYFNLPFDEPPPE